MLKKRIIGTLILKNNIVVQSKRFKSFLPIGKPEIAAEYLNQWGIDELILIDIDATRQNRLINLDIVEKVSLQSKVPIAIGGGINSVDDIRNILSAGGDKVVINSTIMHNPKFLREASEIFGKQCLVCSIDIIKKEKKWLVYDYLNKGIFGKSVSKIISEYDINGCGELFINSVDRDGTYTGLDLSLFNYLKISSKCPIIFSGGIGKPNDFLEGLKHEKIDAVAAANYFHLQEHSVTIVKHFLDNKVLIRNENLFNYKDSEINSHGRLKKKNENILDELLFKKIIMETI